MDVILPIAVSSKLGVTGAKAEHMPFYLRTLFQVLSSWVHRGVFAETPGSGPVETTAKVHIREAPGSYVRPSLSYPDVKAATLDRCVSEREGALSSSHCS